MTWRRRRPSAPPPRQSHRLGRRGVPAAVLIAGVFAYLALSNLLLWAFLGIASPLTVAAGGAVVALLASDALRSVGPAHRVSWPTLAACTGAAAVLLVLSGEGRLFYANADWQVRNAVIADMGRNAWPFAYADGGEIRLLRAPLGMFFVPALVWQVAGERAASFALLIQNACLVGGLLAAAAPLFASRRARLIALATFLAFSGLDILGAFLAGRPIPGHLESWAGELQYSSTVTLLFWAPQHAIAGWAGALCYLLWYHGLAPARLLLTATPLLALWSPLAAIGTLPFAVHAGASIVSQRKVRFRDIAVPALATILAVPALAYLAAGSDGVAARLVAVAPVLWLLVQAIEMLPFVLPLLFAAVAARRFDPVLPIAAAVLLALPFLQIGWSTDLMTRGSIPALAVLAALVARHLAEPAGPWRAWLVAALAVGSLTGAMELGRAFLHPPAPAVACTVPEAWEVTWARFPDTTYLAPLESLPGLVRPQRPQVIPARPGRPCWEGVWALPD